MNQAERQQPFVRDAGLTAPLAGAASAPVTHWSEKSCLCMWFQQAARRLRRNVSSYLVSPSTWIAVYGIVLSAAISLCCCWVWGLPDDGSQLRRAVPTTAFHSLAHMLQTVLWWYFCHGADIPLWGWYAYGILGAVLRGGMRCWTVLSGSDSALTAEDPASIISHPEQTMAYWMFYGTVWLLQAIIPVIVCAPRSAAYLVRERNAEELLSRAKEELSRAEEELSLALSPKEDDQLLSPVQEEDGDFLGASDMKASAAAEAGATSPPPPLRPRTSTMTAGATSPPPLKPRISTTTAGEASPPPLKTRNTTTGTATHRKRLSSGYDVEIPSISHIQRKSSSAGVAGSHAAAVLSEAMAVLKVSGMEQSKAAIEEERYPPAPIWRAWACCGSVVAPAEMELFYFVNGNRYPRPARPPLGCSWCFCCAQWEDLSADDADATNQCCLSRRLRVEEPSSLLLDEGGSVAPAKPVIEITPVTFLGAAAPSMEGHTPQLPSLTRGGSRVGLAQPSRRAIAVQRNLEHVLLDAEPDCPESKSKLQLQSHRRLFAKAPHDGSLEGEEENEPQLHLKSGLTTKIRLHGDYCFCCSHLCTSLACRPGISDADLAPYGRCCRWFCHRRCAAWPPGFMMCVGMMVAFLGPALPLVRIFAHAEIAVSGGAPFIALVFCVAAMFDSYRRDEARRRQDAGTLLGGVFLMEAMVGATGVVLLQALEAGGNSLVFLATAQAYLMLVTIMLSVWERMASAVARHEADRQVFVFVLELLASVYTVLAFVLSLNVDSYEFWISLFTKIVGIILVETQLHLDLFFWYRFGRTQFRFHSARDGYLRLQLSRRSLLAEIIGSGVALVALGVENIALSANWVDEPVLTAARDRSLSTRIGEKALIASACTFVLLRLVTVPVSEWLIRKKLARNRWRKAIFVILGGIRMARRLDVLLVVSAMRRKQNEHIREGGGGGGGGGGEVSILATRQELAQTDEKDYSMQGDSIVGEHFWEFLLAVSFALISAIPGAFFTRARLAARSV
jgi:hypothetical protein